MRTLGRALVAGTLTFALVALHLARIVPVAGLDGWHPSGIGLASLVAAAPVGLALVALDLRLTRAGRERQAVRAARAFAKIALPGSTLPAPRPRSGRTPAQEHVASGRYSSLLYLFSFVALEELARAAAIGLLAPWGVVAAVGLTAVAYGILHAGNGPWVILPKTLVGTAFGILLIVSGTILAPLIAHLTFNLWVRRLLVGFAKREGAEATG